MTREYKIVKIESNGRFNTHIISLVYDKKVLFSIYRDSRLRSIHSMGIERSRDALDKLMRANRDAFEKLNRS